MREKHEMFNVEVFKVKKHGTLRLMVKAKGKFVLISRCWDRTGEAR